MPKPVVIYQIKVTLRGSQPPIWRRIQARTDTTLAKLHRILQRVMGWKDAHPHQIVIRDERYGVPDEEDVGPRKTRDERRYRLSDVVPTEGSQFRYDYDFGDNWQYVLAVEKALPPEEPVRYPVCLAGARACPPEDVGGTPGYEGFLEAISDPKHPDHEECLEWIGGTFDPEAIDMDAVNQLLNEMR